MKTFSKLKEKLISFYVITNGIKEFKQVQQMGLFTFSESLFIWKKKGTKTYNTN